MSEFLTITLDEIEMWDDSISQFIMTEPKEDITFKYTLTVLDKWETKYKKRFIDNSANIEQHEILDFIVMMADKPFDISRLTEANFREIVKYMEDTPSATELPKNNNSSRDKEYRRKKIFTSEIIYAMMALNHIPFDWEDRNLNKLIMLLNCVGALQEPPKKMTQAEAMEEHQAQVLRNRKILEERRKQMNG
jgi:hypothetical protein|nr:MAG TPA: hypothetical protein [Caudoviricetes sp.]